MYEDWYWQSGWQVGFFFIIIISKFMMKKNTTAQSCYMKWLPTVYLVYILSFYGK